MHLSPLSALVHFCPAISPSVAPTTYRSEARLLGWAPGPSLLPQLLSTQLPALPGMCKASASLSRCVSQEQGWNLCTPLPQGPTHLCAGQLCPATKLVWTVCVNVSITKHRWCLQCRFLSFSSFAAMDGVPFMISEKFSCVPESVSCMHDSPSLPPPPA